MRVFGWALIVLFVVYAGFHAGRYYENRQTKELRNANAIVPGVGFTEE